MIIKPLITEKSMSLSKEGKYTFRVPLDARKHQIKKLIEDIFKVHVVKISTITKKGIRERGMSGNYKVKSGFKKAIVSLKDKETIDLFEEKKGK